MENEPKKFNLQHQPGPLQVFIFTIQRSPVAIILNEDIQTILANDEVSARQQVLKNYVQGQVVNIRKRAVFPIDKLLQAVNVAPPTVTVPPLQTQKEIKEMEFITGMLLIVDKFVTEKRDQTAIKRIINKVKMKYESSSTEPGKNVA
jgi:hypothetical protein